MNLPTWLLKLVISFLTERKMIVRYKNQSSSVKDLPGGVQQGTLISLLLLIVLFNDLCLNNEDINLTELVSHRKNLNNLNKIHLKYVDDLTLAKSINMKSLKYMPVSLRPQPDSYYARTGHTLDQTESQIIEQLDNIKEIGTKNKVKLNLKKTKVIMFKNFKKYDFHPILILGDEELQVVNECKLLGLSIRSDLKWKSNTEYMTSKASKKLWIIKRLKNMGASQNYLKEVYIKQSRPVLEYAVPVWNSGITIKETNAIERVRKPVAKIILQGDYTSYKNSLNTQVK